jgi:hypothetical protein
LETYQKPLAAEYFPTGTEATISTIYGLTAGRALIYNQEEGVNGDGQAIFAFIQSGYFDISEGDNMLYMKRFIPDFKKPGWKSHGEIIVASVSSGHSQPKLFGPVHHHAHHAEGGHSCKGASD